MARRQRFSILAFEGNVTCKAGMPSFSQHEKMRTRRWRVIDYVFRIHIYGKCSLTVFVLHRWFRLGHGSCSKKRFITFFFKTFEKIYVVCESASFRVCKVWSVDDSGFRKMKSQNLGSLMPTVAPPVPKHLDSRVRKRQDGELLGRLRFFHRISLIPPVLMHVLYSVSPYYVDNYLCASGPAAK